MTDPAEDTAGDGAGRTEDHVRALHANLIEHYRFHARLAASEFHHVPDVALFLSGRRVNFLNAVMSATFAPAHAAQRVDEVLAPFQDRSVPMRWWTDERGRPADLDANLERRGLEMVWDVPGMTVDLADGLRDDPVDGVAVVVHPVRTHADLRTWFGAFAAGFGFDPHRERAWYEAFEELGVHPDGQLRHYTGFVDGEAVASGTVFIDYGSGSAGIYHVGTRPDRRGRGIGRAVTLVPLLEAREAGMRYGVLKASHLGRSVYERLGFIERARLRQYRWAPPSRDG